jgi:hypothetical protein
MSSCAKLQPWRVLSLQIRGLLWSLLVATLSIPGDCRAQQAQQPPAHPVRSGMGGIASGVVTAPVYGAQRRPIPIQVQSSGSPCRANPIR